MAKKAAARLEVHGLKDLQRELKQMDKELPKRLRVANLKAAKVIEEDAIPRVPVDTGRLAKSVKAQAGQRGATVKAGSKARVPYAGAVHWGWNNRPQGGSNPKRPFIQEALTEKYDEMKETYRNEVDALKNEIGL